MGNGRVEMTIRLNADVTGANSLGEALRGIADEARETAAGVNRVGESMRDLPGLSNIVSNATQALGSLRGLTEGIVGQFGSFDTAMRKVNTMAGKSGAEFDALRGNVNRLGAEIGMTREQLADGLYQVISNGVPEDNWIAFLEQSAKAAKGGCADLGQTVTVTSTMIKNYGLEWSAAQSIQDKIQTTAKNGVTSFEQLAAALPRVTGSAAQLGVSVDELMSVFSTATGVTGNTAEVSTQLSAVLNSLIKPSGEASKAAEAMGIQFDAASIKAAGGFENFLLALDSSIDEYSKQSGQLSETIYGQLFGSAEALRLLGSLTGEQKEKFSENIGAMADSAETINEAFAGMNGDMESFGTKLQNQIASMTDWAGAMLGPVEPLLGIAAGAGEAALSINQLGILMKSTAGAIGQWNLAAKLSAGASQAASLAASAWYGVQTALNLVLSMNPIGIVVIAVGALIAAFVAAYNSCEGFRAVCDRVWSVVKDVAGVVWEYLVAAFERASEVIRTAWLWVKNFFGIEDAGDVEAVTDAIGEQAKATEALTEEQKKLAGLKGLQLSGTGGIDPEVKTGKKKSSPQGSVGWFDEQLQTAEAKLKTVVDRESYNKALEEIGRLRQERFEVTVKLRYDDSEMKKIAERPGKGPAGVSQWSAGLMKQAQIERPADLKPVKVRTGDEERLSAMKQQMKDITAAGQAMSGIFSGIGSAIGGATGEWMDYVGNILSTIPQLITAIQAVTAANAMNSAAQTPVVGWLMVGAAAAAVIASFASLPKFADGGLAYGPTLGLFGEYAGASNNPEVVAPLSRLKDLIEPSWSMAPEKIEFEIRGNRLVGVSERTNRERGRL